MSRRIKDSQAVCFPPHGRALPRLVRARLPRQRPPFLKSMEYDGASVFAKMTTTVYDMEHHFLRKLYIAKLPKQRKEWLLRT